MPTAPEETIVEEPSSTKSFRPTRTARIADPNRFKAPAPRRSSRIAGVEPSRRSPRSNRGVRTTKDLTCTEKGTSGYLEFVRSVADVDASTAQGQIAYWMMLSMDPATGSLDDFMPAYTMMALKAARKTKDPDLPNYAEAMAGEHRAEFEKAMIKEIEELEE